MLFVLFLSIQYNFFLCSWTATESMHWKTYLCMWCIHVYDYLYNTFHCVCIHMYRHFIWRTRQSILHSCTWWRLIVGCNRLLLSLPVKCLPCSVTHLRMHSWKTISTERKQHWFQWDHHFTRTLSSKTKKTENLA